MKKKTKGWMALGVTAVLAAAIPMGANAAEVNTGEGLSSSAIAVKTFNISEDRLNSPGKTSTTGSAMSIRIGVSAEIAKLLGVDSDTLSKELESGKSLLEIAESRGVSKESLLEAQVSALTKPLEDAVKAGRLTQEKADQLKANLIKNAEAIITNKGIASIAPMMPVQGNMSSSVTVSIAPDQELLTFLGIDKETFQSELKNGKSLLQIAETKGITKAQLIEFESKQFAANIDQAVKAGRLTDEQAAKIKEDFAKHAEQRLDGKAIFALPTGSATSIQGGVQMLDSITIDKLSSIGDLPQLPGVEGHAIAVSILPDQELLTFLGIDKETFQSEIKNGKSLLQIAESKGITKTQLIEFESKQFVANIDQAVQAGTMTEEQATKLKENFAASAEQRLTGGPGFALPVRIEHFDRSNLNDQAYELVPALPMEGQVFFTTISNTADSQA